MKWWNRPSLIFFHPYLIMSLYLVTSEWFPLFFEVKQLKTKVSLKRKQIFAEFHKHVNLCPYKCCLLCPKHSSLRTPHSQSSFLPTLLKHYPLSEAFSRSLLSFLQNHEYLTRPWDNQAIFWEIYFHLHWKMKCQTGFQKLLFTG